MRRLSVCLGLALVITLCSACPAMAQGGNVAKGLLDSFVGQTDNWWGILRGYALFLFSTTLIIEVCLFGIRMALQRSDIAETLGQFVTLLLFAGFIAAVIMNYQEWATGIAVKGLQPLTGQLTGNAVDAGKPMAIASILLQKIVLVMKDASVTDIGLVMLYELVLFIIIIVFVLISALIIVVTCEFYIVANIGVLLIGLGGSKIFKDYAVNVMRYVLAVAVKLFVLQLIVNIGLSLISMADLGTASGAGSIGTVKFVDLFYIIGKAVILLALAKTLPETCAGIVNGSAIGGGNPLVSMGRTAGAMALGAASAGAGYAAGLASAVNNAHTIAKGPEADGSATLGGMARAMWNARGDAKAGQAQKELDQNPGSIRNQLRSTANAVKAQRLLNDGDSGEEQSSGASAQAAPPPLAADSYGLEQGQSASQGGTTPPDKPTGGGGSGLPAPKETALETVTAIGLQSAVAGQNESVSAADGYGASPSVGAASGHSANPGAAVSAADGYEPESGPVSTVSASGHSANPGTAVTAADNYGSSPAVSTAPLDLPHPVNAADDYDSSPSLAAASGISSRSPYQNSYPAKKRRKSRKRKH